MVIDIKTIVKVAIALAFISCSRTASQPEIDMNGKIQSWAAQPSPEVEICYSNPAYATTWVAKVESDSIKFYCSGQCGESAAYSRSLLFPSRDVDNIRKLIGALNPATVPFYYGDRVAGDPHVVIMVENDTILVDKDFCHSVIPAEIQQLYNYIFYDTYGIRKGERPDFPPYRYGEE